MKYVFVRFEEEHLEGVFVPMTLIVTGEAAESPDQFIKWQDTGVTIRVLDWFEVPEAWENLVADGLLNKSFAALLGLDDLNDETPVVSDLLASIFETGYRMAIRKKG